MSDTASATLTHKIRLLFSAALLLVLACAATLLYRARRATPESERAPVASLPKADESEATHDQVMEICAACHKYPPAEIFAKDQWHSEVARGFDFFRQAHMNLKPPSQSSVVRYYEKRAPAALPVLKPEAEPYPFPVEWKRIGWRDARERADPGIANVRFVHLTDEHKLDVIACDMMHGKVFLLRPYEPSAKLETLCELIPNPAHAEVVDLNNDGIKDLLIANLGSPIPTEQKLGSVVWLKGSASGSFTPITLASELGRVADVEAADFDGDGDLDLVVAAFGRLSIGEILYLENRTTDESRPQFVATTLDGRHGAIHVPVADLNGDGRPDFVALISQEHETVVAFLNAGGGRFDPHVIYAAPHPAYGSSGIELVDLDGDGDLDVLMTNGDVLDSTLLRPYHGVQWLENQGSYPFQHHHLAAHYGAHRAVAADIDGDGDLDIVAASFLPGEYYRPFRKELNLDAVIVLEQTTPGQFVRHSLEKITCDHATCDVGDFDGDGRVDMVIGNLLMSGMPGATATASGQTDAVIIDRNLGTKAKNP